MAFCETALVNVTFGNKLERFRHQDTRIHVQRLRLRTIQYLHKFRDLLGILDSNARNFYRTLLYLDKVAQS